MISELARFALAVPLFAFLGFFFLCELPLVPDYVLLLSVTVALLGLFCVLCALRLSLILLGAMLLILPMFGSGVLNIFLLFWVFGVEMRRLTWRGRREEGILYAERFLSLGVLACTLGFLCASMKTLLESCDFTLLWGVWDFAGPYELLRYLVLSVGSWKEVPVFVGGYVLCGLLASAVVHVHRESDGLNYVLIGLALGAICASCVAWAQYAGMESFLLINRSAFWQSVGRYSATLTDPNSFGIVAALLVPVLFFAGSGRIRILTMGAAVVLLISVSLSGSRTFWLAILLWVFGLLGRLLLRRGVMRALIGGGLSLVLLGCIFLALRNPEVNQFVRKAVALPSVSRLLMTIDSDHSGSMLFSRSIYADIAARVWQKDPLIGTGIGRFREVQGDIAGELGVDLKGWRDNANNYYLHILAEQGALGLIVHLFAFYLLALGLSGQAQTELGESSRDSLREPQELLFISRYSLSVMLVLFFVGPHIFFDEVRALVAIIMGMGFCFVHCERAIYYSRMRSLLFALTFALPTVVICLLPSVERTARDRGFYQRELGQQGAFAWTGRRAQIWLCPVEKEEPLLLSFRAGNPDIETNPLDVTIYSVAGKKLEFQAAFLLSRHSWKTLAIDGKYLSGGMRQGLLIEVGRLWKPQGDNRWLGVMLKWPENACY